MAKGKVTFYMPLHREDLSALEAGIIYKQVYSEEAYQEFMNTRGGESGLKLFDELKRALPDRVYLKPHSGQV